MRIEQVQEIERILKSISGFLRHKLPDIVQEAVEFEPNRDCRELLSLFEQLREFGFNYSPTQHDHLERMIQGVEDSFNTFVNVLRDVVAFRKAQPGSNDSAVVMKANEALRGIHDQFLVGARSFSASLTQPIQQELGAKGSLSAFICYRRADASWVVDRLYRYLVERYDGVFRDLDSIPLGEPFPQFIKRALANASAVLVIIGPTWLNNSKQSRSRLFDPEDHVRIEIESALSSKAKVIPVLLSPAAMPTASDLPASIRRLAELNALTVRPDPDFNNDMERLCRHLR